MNKLNLNPFTWTKPMWDAAGRHVLTSLGTALPILVMLGVIKAEDATTWLAWVTNVLGAVAALFLALAPIYAAIKAATTASPENQAKQTVVNLESGVPLNGKRDELIAAVANQPDVAQIEMESPIRGLEIPSNKVV